MKEEEKPALPRPHFPSFPTHTMTTQDTDQDMVDSSKDSEEAKPSSNTDSKNTAECHPESPKNDKKLPGDTSLNLTKEQSNEDTVYPLNNQNSPKETSSNSKNESVAMETDAHESMSTETIPESAKISEL